MEGDIANVSFEFWRNSDIPGTIMFPQALFTKI